MMLNFVQWNLYIWTCEIFLKRIDLTICGNSTHVAPFTNMVYARRSNYNHYKVWDEITHPFLNFNGATVEV